jgi:DNA replication protein DnaC
VHAGVAASIGGPAGAVGAASAVGGELAFLCRALKAPRIAEALPVLGERARAEGWSHEQFLATLLEREVSARQQMGGEARIRGAGFPARKTLDGFDFAFQTSIQKTVVLHLGQLDFLAAKHNVVFLGPPGTGKTHCENGVPVAASVTQKTHWLLLRP